MEFPVHITAFYAFLPLDAAALAARKAEFDAFAAKQGMRGLVLLAPEGINGTVCGTPEAIARWKDTVTAAFPGVIFKDSGAKELVFPRWFVKIREEIVTLGKPEVRPDGRHKHLTPEEWDAMLENGDVVLIDTRNTYETDIGMFEGAIDPRIEKFQDFPAFVQNGGIPKDKKVLMYCTGGIRCEKALLEMESQGYENVYQLEGGILAYLAKFPHKKFKGECFVFDHRVSVDQDLSPSSRYALCPHCGDPGDISIVCLLCKNEGRVCGACHAHEERRTCSKDCKGRLAAKLARAS